MTERNFTREEMIRGLQAGHTLNIDRRDAPELDDIRDMEREGFVTTRLVEIDDQSSVLQVRWRKP